jgi:hypothetical protein
MRINFKNQYPAELATDITTGSTTFVLKSGQGANFPQIALGEDKYFLVAVVDKNGNREIARIIQRSAGSDTLVVGTTAAHQPSGDVAGRAQEGTTAIPVTASDDHVVELRLTAGTMEALAGPIPATTAEMQATADPYPASVASLATDMAGVIQRIHYLIKQITGEAQWYIDPDIALTTLATRSVPTNAVLLFESDTAVTGYTLLVDLNDLGVYITSGSGAGGQTGATGKTGGTWTLSGLSAAAHTHDLSNHTHTGPSHTHAGVDHLHSVSLTTGAGQNWGYPDPGRAGTSGDSAPVDHNHAVSGYTAGADRSLETGSNGTGATGAPSNNTSGGASATGVSSTGVWRPPGVNYTRQRRN